MLLLIKTIIKKIGNRNQTLKINNRRSHGTGAKFKRSNEDPKAFS